MLIVALAAIPYYFPKSSVPKPFYIVFQISQFCFLPGLLASALFSGNIHNIGLAAAIVFNWLIYALLIFLVLGLSFRNRRLRE
jgi:hypothetical protein